MDEFKVPILPPPPVSTSAENTDKITEANVEKSRPEKDTLKIKPSLANAPECPYKTPVWSAPPVGDAEYKFEVLKSGQIIDEVSNLQQKAVWTFGRLPNNDIEMAHPTISRFHAVLQYRPSLMDKKNNEEEGNLNAENKTPAEGWYIYDLGSTHGTFLNKQQIPPKTYIRIKVGHMLKLGASTRNFILQGPADDEEPESELSVTELRALRSKQEEAKALEAQRQAEEREKEGISWGMSEDADEESDLSVNPYASTNNEELFLDDPKRTLRGFFEREGLTLEYKCDEMSAGSFVCRVELPLDDSNGRPIIAEVVHKGRKKECVVQCALEACRILDRHGVLRQANQEPLKRKVKTEDSDDDDFWDRTGDVERKKQRKANAGTEVTLTYDDLILQEIELLENIKNVDNEVEEYQDLQKRLKSAKTENKSEDIDLDSYMENLSYDGKQFDKTTIRKLRMRQQQLKADLLKLQRLIKVAKPIDLPSIQTEVNSSNESKSKRTIATKQMLMIGKRNQFSKLKLLERTKTANSSEIKTRTDNPVVEEEDDEDDTENAILSDVSKYSANNESKSDENIKQCSSNSELNCETSVNCSGQSNITENYTEEITNSIQPAIEHEQQSNESAASAAAKKRQRQRQRTRNKRSEVDIDELAIHESEEKYAKWVPPENQTGDGITELNKKFGY